MAMRRILYWALTAGVFAAAVVATAFADPIEDATTAYWRGDYATALRLFRTLADSGDAHAEVIVGEIGT
jgi:uncharacterized protein